MKQSMKPEITGHTRLYGLLGSPVSHSKSPLMHNESFRMLGIDAVYLAFDVTADTFDAALTGIRAMNVLGFNCTMPLKRLMYERADALSDAAKIIGAVNTVVNQDGFLTAHNTDGAGYMAALANDGVSISGGQMTLLGAGGAAAAIAAQAALDGVEVLHIFARPGASYDSMQEEVTRILEMTDCKAALYPLSDEAQLQKSIGDSTLLTNASSVGMAPRTNASLITDTSLFHSDLTVSDVIYNPAETLLLQQARAAGCRTQNGLYMLLYQGAYAFELWTGQQMPIEHIRQLYFS